MLFDRVMVDHEVTSDHRVSTELHNHNRPSIQLPVFQSHYYQ
jgi:hypothetical protein